MDLVPERQRELRVACVAGGLGKAEEVADRPRHSRRRACTKSRTANGGLVIQTVRPALPRMRAGYPRRARPATRRHGLRHDRRKRRPPRCPIRHSTGYRSAPRPMPPNVCRTDRAKRRSLGCPRSHGSDGTGSPPGSGCRGNRCPWLSDHVVRIRQRGKGRILGSRAIEDPVDMGSVHAPLPKPVHQPVG